MLKAGLLMSAFGMWANCSSEIPFTRASVYPRASSAPGRTSWAASERVAVDMGGFLLGLEVCDEWERSSPGSATMGIDEAPDRAPSMRRGRV